MGWSVGYDDRWSRWIGYGVPAYCDHPKCSAEINRGLAYVCGNQEPHGGEHGCGLFFCGKHLRYHGRKGYVCARCGNGRTPYAPKPEHPRWIAHLLTDESWAQWRAENPAEVERMRAILPGSSSPSSGSSPGRPRTLDGEGRT